MKKIISIFLTFAMLLSIGVFAFADELPSGEPVTQGTFEVTGPNDETYITDANGNVAYRIVETDWDYFEIPNDVGQTEHIDLIGHLDGEWRQTTYGYYGVVSGIQDESGNHEIYDLSGTTINGVLVSVTPSITEDGTLIQFTYEATNTTDEAKTFSIFAYSDAQLVSDRCPIIDFGLEDGESAKENSYFALQYNLAESGASEDKILTFAVCPIDATTTSYGNYRGECHSNPCAVQPEKGGLTNTDSGWALSWKIENLAANAVAKAKAFFGIGDVSKIEGSVKKEEQKAEEENNPSVDLSDYYIPTATPKTIVNLPEYFHTNIFDGIVKNEALLGKNYSSEAVIPDNQLLITADMSDGDISVRKLIISPDMLKTLLSLKVETVKFVVGDVEYVISVSELSNYIGTITITVDPITGETSVE